ncbi:hypothetical protein AVEN_253124-1 [Araneus ventricosus]|uniref:Uncharacterized protein n=1 Tax=Araneus ventricosus TaxID=182803 RepID=A0A4Y2HEC3_ARAVE|nr:hypothetical protein AVEN_253124-1 [Araneus ventricosus]
MYEKTPFDVTTFRGEYLRAALGSERRVLIDWNDFGVSSAVRAGELSAIESGVIVVISDLLTVCVAKFISNLQPGAKRAPASQQEVEAPSPVDGTFNLTLNPKVISSPLPFSSSVLWDSYDGLCKLAGPLDSFKVRAAWMAMLASIHLFNAVFLGRSTFC